MQGALQWVLLKVNKPARRMPVVDPFRSSFLIKAKRPGRLVSGPGLEGEAAFVRADLDRRVPKAQSG
jgi:hypothetical protein